MQNLTFKNRMEYVHSRSYKSGQNQECLIICEKPSPSNSPPYQPKTDDNFPSRALTLPRCWRAQCSETAVMSPGRAPRCLGCAIPLPGFTPGHPGALARKCLLTITCSQCLAVAATAAKVCRHNI